MFYSKSTNGFYTPEIHGDTIPADNVEISTEYHAELLQAQSDGKQIIADDDGYPIAIDPVLPVRTKESLIAEVAAKRWVVETGGIVVAGHHIATDRESQAQLISAYTSLKGALINDTPWKAADGRFTLATLTEIEPFAQAVAAHVRACFSAEQAHGEAINALTTQEELDGYDANTGWPANPA